jgi:GT2 family glycosyltransferase
LTVRTDPIRVTVSIVVYKPDCDLLVRVLTSLRRAADYASARLPLKLSVCLVDNSLEPQWRPRIEAAVRTGLGDTEAEIRLSPVNGGYGAGNNLAIRTAQSDYHIVANPDVFLDEDTLFAACQYMERHPEVKLLTPQVRGEDGELHYLCKRHPSLFIMFLRGFAPLSVRRHFRGLLERFEMRDHDYAGTIEGVGYPTGCFMFFRTEALQAIGGFDERFFMYLEDADIGRRILQLGDVRYVPSVKIVHRWARGSHRDKRLRWITVQSALIYWRKWGGLLKPTRDNP